jgi:hypothetical protein
MCVFLNEKWRREFNKERKSLLVKQGYVLVWKINNEQFLK